MKQILTDNTILTDDKRFTFLSTDVASGGTSLSVQSIIGFESLSTSSGQIVCIGEIGNEKTEILKTSSAIGPSGTTITLNSTLTFDHPQDTKVYIIDWDRIQVQWASTAIGTKETLTAYPFYIRPDQSDTDYKDTAKTSGFYFTRFNETVGNTNSDWSDPIPYAGFADNTVYMIKKRALDSVNEEIDGKIITHEFLNESLWQARREYHNLPGKRPFRRVFNADLGNVSTGIFRIALPTDVESPYTAENVFGVRIGIQNNMSYYDKKDWDQDYKGSAHSILLVAHTTATDQDLWLDNVRDFEDSGSVTIEDDIIGYSAKGVSGGTLRISSYGDYSHAIYSDTWQNKSSGLPTNFTVWMNTDGTAYIYFSCPISTSYVNQNIWGDYYRTLVPYDSDADILDEPQYVMYVPYLAWKIKKKKNSGLIDVNDPDYQEWIRKMGNSISKEYLGTEIRISPDVEPL